jgi:hypothetical protein
MTEKDMMQSLETPSLNTEEEFELQQESEGEKEKIVLKDKPVLTKSIKEYQKMIYELCQLHHPELIKIAKIFLHRAKNLYDNHVTVEGGTGSGKSMLTFVLVHLIHYLQDTTFHIEKQTLFIPDQGELKKEMKALKERDVYWLDEAIRALDKKQWYNINQIELNHIAKTERWKCNTIFYNIQRFAELTETFRNSNIHFRIFVIKRYACVLYIKDEDKDIEDPWHIKENLSMKFRNSWSGQFRYNVAMAAEEVLHKEIKLPNYFMYSKLPNLESFPSIKEYWNYYQWLKQESRKKEQEKDEGKTDKPLSRAEKMYRDNFVKLIFDELCTGKYKNPKELYFEKYSKVFTDHTFYGMVKEAEEKSGIKFSRKIGKVDKDSFKVDNDDSIYIRNNILKLPEEGVCEAK